MFKGQTWNASRRSGGLGVGQSGRRRNLRLGWTVYCIYGAATLAYSLYSSSQETGLAGYLMKIELDLFGRAEVYGTILLMTIGWLLGYLVIAEMIGKFVPSLAWLYPDTSGESRMNRPLGPITWKRIFWISTIPILIGGVTCPILYFFMHRDDHKKVYSLDLTSVAAASPKGAKFVNVTGVIAKKYLMSFKWVTDNSAVHEIYAPITEEGWTPGNLVRYFVAVRAGEDSGYQVKWPEAIRNSGATRLSGRIGGSLSTFVESAFRSKGLKIAESYSVISLENLDQTSAFSWGDALVFIVFGVFGSVVIFTVMAMVKKAALPRK